VTVHFGEGGSYSSTMGTEFDVETQYCEYGEFGPAINRAKLEEQFYEEYDPEYEDHLADQDWSTSRSLLECLG